MILGKKYQPTIMADDEHRITQSSCQPQQYTHYMKNNQLLQKTKEKGVYLDRRITIEKKSTTMTAAATVWWQRIIIT